MYRFLCGFGVGGQFAVGVALVAEVVPDRARPYASGMVQAFSAVGNMLAALIGIVLGQMVRSGDHRFFLALHVPGRRAARAAGAGGLQEAQGAGAVAQDRAPKRSAWVRSPTCWASRAGAATPSSACCWPSPAWSGFGASASSATTCFVRCWRRRSHAQGFSGAELAGKTDIWIGVTSLLQNLGGFFGVYAYTYLAQYLNRRKAFAVSFVAAMGMTAYTFWNLKSIGDMLWMIPLMGFCQLALFGGYAIYLPELFPTRLRSTGTSFCYNVGRMVAAAGPFTLGLLTRNVFKGYPEPLRYAGVTMCLVFLVGLAALPFAPETKGKAAAGVTGRFLLRFFDLLAEVAFVADLADLVDLGFQPIHVLLFILQQTFEEFARGIVAFVARNLNEAVVHRDSADLQFEIALQLLLDVRSNVELHQLRQVGRPIQEQDPLDNRLGVLHFIDGLLLDEGAKPVVVPVLAHLGVQEVLVDRRQLFL